MSGYTSTCELLGYPADARLLIINADDFGLCHGQNEGTMQAIKRGLCTSCSLMTPAPWSLHATHLLQENPQIPFAVHLCAVSEYAHYRWKPLTCAEKVPSLADETGYFYRDDRIAELLSKASLDELETEFRAQIEAVLSSGLNPTHIDSHYHVHALREDMYDMTVGLAIEYGLALRVGDRARIEKLQARGYPTSDHAFLDSGKLSPSDVATFLADRLRELPSGLSEWALHPGIATEELKAVMSDPAVEGVSGTPEGRQSDLDFITSEEAATIVSEEGIQLLSFEPLQRLWQTRTATRGHTSA